MNEDEVQNLIYDLLAKVDVDEFSETLIYNYDELADIIKRHTTKFENLRRAVIAGPYKDGSYYVSHPGGYSFQSTLENVDKNFWFVIQETAKQNRETFGDL